MKKNTSLSSALTLILICMGICVALTVAAAIVTGELLFLVASVLFAVAGGSGVWVVRRLQRTIGRS